MSSSGSHLSREFFDLVKAIGECRSKQEEDAIIEHEMAQLRVKLADQGNLSNFKKIKEFLVRSIYVEMLGHDASSFAYIHAVNLCSQAGGKNLYAKRVGYLVCCLFLDPKSEFMILLINTIQKDLRSTNLLEVCFALSVVARLANGDMAPVLVQLVQPLLKHASELVRRKAVTAFHKLVQVAPELVAAESVQSVVRKAISDPDPGVMAVALHPLLEFARSDPDAWRDLVPSLVKILEQIINYKLPVDFEYHRLPAPWLQVKLVSILAVLGQGHEAATNMMANVLGEVMRKCDVVSNAGAAIVVEVINAAAIISPNHTLLEHSSLMVGKFMATDGPSSNNNFKYVGISVLANLVAINPVYANEHQIKVVECLEDPDPTLRRKTLDLLFHMCNANNVTVIVDKMLQALSDGESKFHKELVYNICTLAEKFAPNSLWYLQTVNQVYARAGQVVPYSVGANLVRLVAEEDGSEGDLRVEASNAYIELLEQFVGDAKNNACKLSSEFLQLIVWMIGEFATMSTLDGYSVDDTVDLLIDGAKIVQQNGNRRIISTSDSGSSSSISVPECASVVSSFVWALGKLFQHASVLAQESVKEFLGSMQTDDHVHVRQRCSEQLFIQQLSKSVQALVLPFDASCEDIQIDFKNLDKFVINAKAKGARPYSKTTNQFKEHNNASAASNITSPPSSLKGLRFEAYAPPIVAPSSVVIAAPVAVAKSSASNGVSPSASPLPAAPPTSNGATAKRWGPSPSLQPPTVVQAQIKVQATLPTLPPVAPPPQLNESYLEKQRVAAALFTGVGPVKTNTWKPTPVSKAPQASVAATNNRRSSAENPETKDLLDLVNDSGSNIKRNAVSHAQSTAGTNNDLLGLD